MNTKQNSIIYREKPDYELLPEDMLEIVMTPGYIPRSRPKYKNTSIPTWSYAELQTAVFHSFAQKFPLLILGANSGVGKSDAVRCFAKQIAACSTIGTLLEEDDFNFALDPSDDDMIKKTEYDKKSPKEFIDWSEIDGAKKHEVINNPHNYFVFRKFISNEMKRPDIRGNPTPTGEGHYIHQLNLDLKVCVADNIEGIIFIDNYGQGSEEVNAGLRKLFIENRLGDTKLSPGFLIILASDFPDDNTRLCLDINSLPNIQIGALI